jgi:hypothetical protein
VAAAHLESSQLHGTHEALRKGAVVVDDDERTILGQLVLPERKILRYASP